MGKSSKKRNCPAINQTISRSDCGQNRHTRYPCPAECPYNPLAPAHYDQFLEIESLLDKKIVGRMPTDFSNPFFGLPGGRSLVLSSPFEAGKARAMWKLFYERNPTGTTWTQGWEAEGFKELKNDEVAVLKGKMRSRMALLEIRRIVDDQTVEAIDLFDPEGTVISVVDRSTAARAVRFVTYLGWIFPAPHFWKLTGAAIEVSEQGLLEPVEVVKEVVRYHGGSDATGEMEVWLAENYALVCETLLATVHERRRQMFSELDLMMGEVDYELTAPYAKCRKRLDSSPFTDRAEIEEEELEEGFAETRIWFVKKQRKKNRASSEPHPMLGCVLLGQEKWRLEAASGARLTRLRTDFEKLMGPLVVFKSEKRDDTASLFAMKEPEGDQSLIPPRLLEHPTQLGIEQSQIEVPMSGDDPGAAILGQALSNWADEPVPALDGLSPRAAANDLILRPRVITLVKSKVTTVDRRNLREGRTDDINGLIRELGLREIDEPPPPKRAVPEEDFSNEPDERPGENWPLPDVPWDPAEDVNPLTSFSIADHVLDPDESDQRLESAIAHFGKRVDPEQWVLDIADVIYVLTEDILEGREFDILLPFLVFSCHVLIPPGLHPPPYSQARIESAVVKSIKKTPGLLKLSGRKFADRMTTRRRQPDLAEALLIHFMALIENLQDESFLSSAKPVYIMNIAVTVMDELDRAIRG